MIPPNNNTPETTRRKVCSTTFKDGWSLHTAHELGSTNSAAARLPAWHAVRASVQTNGRGRTGRTWVSDEGGLWLSAVLPCPGLSSQWSIFPLAAGWAIIGALNDLGTPGLRLRWPNDIMAGQGKLAGLLVERFTADTAVVGIGLNVFNSPGSCDTSLARTTTRLADLVSAGCALDELTHLVLRSIRRAHAIVLKGEFHVIARELNTRWSEPRLVSISLNGHAHPFTGLFTGIDDAGRLQVSTDYSRICSYEPSQVALLRELE
jgi:BirA family biotin operon repressor/biotin-[acetyl-CoA-carboxylase] ligase